VRRDAKETWRGLRDSSGYVAAYRVDGDLLRFGRCRRRRSGPPSRWLARQMICVPPRRAPSGPTTSPRPPLARRRWTDAIALPSTRW